MVLASFLGKRMVAINVGFRYDRERSVVGCNMEVTQDDCGTGQVGVVLHGPIRQSALGTA